MEREDPLERLERKEQEKKANGPLRTIMFVMAGIAAALAVVLACVLVSGGRDRAQYKALVDELNFEKDSLTLQIQSVNDSLATLNTTNAYINAQLDSSRAEVALLIENLRKTQATDRAQLRKYEKELGTLRTIMRSYIVQIDSLNTLNHQLTVKVSNARKEADEQRKRGDTLAQEVESLSARVATGSIIHANGLKLSAFTNKDKTIDKAAKASYLRVDLTLLRNDLAEQGTVVVYVRVKDPDGNLLQDGTGASLTYDGQELSATASRPIDYAGSDVPVSVYINNVPSYVKGIYTAEVYTNQTLLGSTELMLR